MKIFLLLAVLLISSCPGPVLAFPEKGKVRGEDKFDLKKRPKTTPGGIPILKICIDNVVYYANPIGGLTPALTTEGKIILCGEHKT